jgi:2-phospho-L-lactate guanylyltransferase
MDGVEEARWSLVVPLKPLAVAKSRLAAAGAVRPALALAFALDTVGAALCCPEVADVTVVTDDPAAGAELAGLGAIVVPDSPGDGLNAALRHGEAVVRARRPHAPVAALNGDLPALRAPELAEVLRAAAGACERAFLADAAGIGTTLLAAVACVPLAPGFGGASRARHLASGAAEITLPAAPSVRQDVDTLDDLAAAMALGVGAFTAGAAAALAPQGAPACG